MNCLPYSRYKNSGVRWIGEIPSKWDLVSLRHLTTCLDGRRIPLNGAERSEMLGNIPYWGANGIVDYVSKSIFDEELVLIGEDGAPFFDKTKDVAFLINEPIWPNNHIHVLRPRNVFAGWLTYALNAVDYGNYIEGSTRDKLTQSNLNSIVIPTPSLEEQQKIANFLDHETAKIDELIKKQENLIDLYGERINALVSAGLESPHAKYIRFMHACDVMSRPIFQSGTNGYKPLGLYNRGRGIFIKEERDAEDMGDSDFFWVKSGDLIFSGQFAWEGAVAMAQDEHNECVVSHRYPVVRGREGIALTEYLLALFLTPHGDFLLNENSRGAAGRNRPLNISLLLKEKIPIIDMQSQLKIKRLIEAKERFLKKSAQGISLLKEHRASLISAAVTGKIDISNCFKNN